jgi:hypothetical protein
VSKFQTDIPQRRYTKSQQVYEAMFHIARLERGKLNTRRSLLIPVRMAVNKMMEGKCWWGCGGKGNLLHSENVNFYHNYGKQYGVSSENENTAT